MRNRYAAIFSAILGSCMALPALAIELGAAELVAQRCSTCHGAQGQSTSPIFPSLAGQNREYLAKQLTDFRAKKRVSETMAPGGRPVRRQHRCVGCIFCQ